jgi:hypothetical protein
LIFRLINLSKTKDNLIGLWNVEEYFLPVMELLWIWGWEEARGVDGGTGGGWR